MAPKPRSSSWPRPAAAAAGRWVHLDGVEGEVARVLRPLDGGRGGPRPAVRKVDDGFPSSIRSVGDASTRTIVPSATRLNTTSTRFAWYGCSSSSTQIPTVSDPPAVSVPPGSRVAVTPSHDRVGSCSHLASAPPPRRARGQTRRRAAR